MGYVERNALRAKLVTKAEAWQWPSLWRRTQGDAKATAWLSEWPVTRPRDWIGRVNRADTKSELEALRTSVQRGRLPYGAEDWVRRRCRRCGVESTLRPPGRPKGS
jgi:putative transposase